jgi:hypothetical protein
MISLVEDMSSTVSGLVFNSIRENNEKAAANLFH